MLMIDSLYSPLMRHINSVMRFVCTQRCIPNSACGVNKKWMKKALRGEANTARWCSKRAHKQTHKQTDTHSQGWLQYSAQLSAQWNKSHLDRPMRKETRTFYSLITDVLLTSQNVWYRWCELQIITRVYSRGWRQQNRYSGQQGQQMHNILRTINMKRGIPRPSDSPIISTRSRCVDATVIYTPTSNITMLSCLFS